MSYPHDLETGAPVFQVAELRERCPECEAPLVWDSYGCNCPNCGYDSRDSEPLDIGEVN